MLFPFISRINPSGVGVFVKDLFSDGSEVSFRRAIILLFNGKVNSAKREAFC